MTGRLLHEGWGKASFWLMFVGFNALFFPMHILGLRGQPRRTYTYQSGLGWDFLNLLETVGAFVLALGILVTFVNWVWSTKRGKPAGHDPWGGETLEWATTSPPAEYNFENIPTVRSLEPMWDQPELGARGQPPEAGGRSLGGGHNTLGTSLLEADPEVAVGRTGDRPAEGVVEPIVTGRAQEVRRSRRTPGDLVLEDDPVVGVNRARQRGVLHQHVLARVDPRRDGHADDSSRVVARDLLAVGIGTTARDRDGRLRRLQRTVARRRNQRDGTDRRGHGAGSDPASATARTLVLVPPMYTHGRAPLLSVHAAY
jgi:hypothetical protein